VYIDEALNVIYPVNCDGDHPITIYMAHSDVVFPDTDPLPLRVEDGKIFCPGIGDDTANAVALLMVAKYIANEKPSLDGEGVLIVINSGEEGLGNLKGSRKIMQDFGSRTREFVTFDGSLKSIINRAVGSKRYRISIKTEGGHSYSAFGNRNAIAYLASLIDTLYTIKVPNRGKTTYNVGLISGGTSVNTIAENAEMLYEFRSDNREDLAEMEKHLEAALDFYRTKGITIESELLGDRPCGREIDEEKEKALIERTANAIKAHYGPEPILRSASTDCNIPLSMGIPSICTGCIIGAGAHTRGEWVAIDSLHPGLLVAFEMVLHHFN
jgi:acetylornithine deacetylase/succinyl-diaminopimelate desuccinylase-like protein